MWVCMGLDVYDLHLVAVCVSLQYFFHVYYIKIMVQYTVECMSMYTNNIHGVVCGIQSWFCLFVTVS